jgi:hypothetical protein
LGQLSCTASRRKLTAIALFKSMAKTADTAGTIFPGTIVPIRLEPGQFLELLIELVAEFALPFESGSSR